jgi:magnesium transporter
MEATMLGTIFSKHHPKVGAKPGTLVIPKEAPTPKVRIISYSLDAVNDVVCPNENLDRLSEAFGSDAVTWIDVQGFGDTKIMRKIGSIFDLHPLLLEDVVNVPQRPKTETYGDQLLVIVRMVRLDDSGQIDMEQLSVILGKNYVITFQERYGDVFDPVRERIRIPKSRLRTHGADYLSYALIDTVVDGYYPVLETVGDYLESLESQVIADPSPELLGQLNHFKNRLVNLRRGIWPQREAIAGLARGDQSAITEEVRVYLRDTYDHCVQTSELTEMYREMVTGLMNVYLSSVANRTNDVMKMLTIVATIFIPLTFLAGIYGMNFEHMPELHSEWAYPAIWLTMLAVAGIMLSFFWRKGWIGPKR